MARRRWLTVRGQLALGAVWIVLGAGTMLLSAFGVLRSGEWQAGVPYLAVGALLMAAALLARRRQQRRYAQVPTAAAPEVVTLARQGQKIKAIRLYRKLNPGTGLKEAKDAVDQL